ncbi:molybdenum cofactor guanylyltransferase [Oceanobacillus limi]|uniref:Probable molybdenum cofactor guanylyltransferase n=1 Tax=Oceanobacillus limi TaxID=930131 RepID=A0A1H9ZCW3_9BACI|nr:molybdenum cofactor guanylyltransferase [Oceanobacillus limi]SES79322.1 molybdenum cofactor guanylyltransferase [Oceanobacillus limi]
MKVCSVVLSGGNSSRMGTNKSLLKLNGKTVIESIIKQLERCSDEIVVSANNNKDYDFLSVPIINDRFNNKGPLAGMEAALYYIKADYYVIAACDMPFVDSKVYRYLINNIGSHDAIIPVYQGRIHPVSGVFKRDVLPHIQHLLNRDQLSIRKLFNHINVKFMEEFTTIPSSQLENHFFNMNKPADYEKAKFLSGLL